MVKRIVVLESFLQSLKYEENRRVSLTTLYEEYLNCCSIYKSKPYRKEKFYEDMKLLLPWFGANRPPVYWVKEKDEVYFFNISFQKDEATLQMANWFIDFYEKQAEIENLTPAQETCLKLYKKNKIEILKRISSEDENL